MNIVTAFDLPAAISESLLAGHKVNVCPLWVISGHLQCKTTCPLYPQKRTTLRGVLLLAIGHASPYSV